MMVLKPSARTPPPTLLFLSSLVKEQVPQSETQMNLASARRPKAPASRGSGTQFLKTAPSMKLFYSNPTGRSTLIFEYFSKFCAALTVTQYSHKLHRSQKRIRLCVYVFLINLIDPETSSMSSEEPWRFTNCWQNWLVPPIRTFERLSSGPRVRPGSCEPVSLCGFEIEARPN